MSWHGKKMIDEIGSFKSFEMLKAFVFFGGYHDHCGFPVFGHSLRLAARSLNDLAEPIFASWTDQLRCARQPRAEIRARIRDGRFAVNNTPRGM